MKTLLIILLASFSAFSQCPEDLWRSATPIGNTPMEVQMGKGQAVIVLVFERKDTTIVDTFVITKKGTTPAPVVLKETINDADPRVTYVGVWSKGTNQPWTQSFLNKDVSYTYGINANASLSFTGKRIEVIAEKRSNHGVAKIEIKQGTTVVDSQTVDMYTDSDVNAPSVLYSKELPQGTYTITVSLNSVSVGKDSMVIDSFLVYE